MSNQNLSKQNEINKPKPTMQSTINRTVSAGYEVSTEQVENLIKEKNKELTKDSDPVDSSKKTMKLNVNANTYIPKNKLIPKPLTEQTSAPSEQPKISMSSNKGYMPPQTTQNFNMMNTPMMMMNNPAYYPRMPNPYMMQPPQIPYNPMPYQPMYNSQNMGIQQPYTNMYTPKQQYPQSNSSNTSTIPQTTSSTRFSIDAPIYTPKTKTSGTTSNLQQNNQKETLSVTTTTDTIIAPTPTNINSTTTPVETPEVVVPEIKETENVRVKQEEINVERTDKKLETQTEEKTQENQSPIIIQSEETTTEIKEKPQVKEAPILQTKPAETPTKKSALNNLFSKTSGAVIKSTPTVVQTNVSKPTIRKNDKDEKINELQKKLNKTNKIAQERKPSVPKKQKDSQNNIPQRVEEEVKVQEPEPEPEPEPEEKWQIYRHYFKVSDKKKEETKKRLDVDFLMHFKDWKISKETLLIEDLINNHLKKMEEYQDEQPKKQQRVEKGYGKKDRYSSKQSLREPEPQPTINIQTSNESSFTRQTNAPIENKANVGIGIFARKNLEAENKEAESYKNKLDEKGKIDPIKDEIQIHLNVLTLDNYEEIKKKIFELIKGDVTYQEKLIEVLFKKAIFEWTYVVIYSKLCFDLDKELPQRSEIDLSKTTSTSSSTSTSTTKRPKATSIFRSKLIDKCKKVFKEDQTQFFLKYEDPEERDQMMKQYTLGNVNFIAELINQKILIKKVVFQCVEHLFLKNIPINIEGIVILLDKFGTCINKNDKLKADDLNNYNELINNHLVTLNLIQENDKTLPGYIRYKIINLIDKRDRGWVESKVDLVKVIKSKTAVSEEYDQEMREKGEVRETVSKKNIDFDKFRKFIMDDLEAWKTEDQNHFDWTNVEKIKKFGLSTVLKCFAEAIVDAIGREEDIESAFTYIKTIISYYSNNIYKDDRADIITVTLNCLEFLSDYTPDNHYLTDIWGKVFNLLINQKLFIYKDLERLSNLNDDQIECITTVVCKAVIDSQDESVIDNELLKLSFFRASKKLLMEKYSKLTGK